MYTFIILLFFILNSTYCEESEINVIPLPARVDMHPGIFLFHQNVSLKIPKNDSEVRYAAEFLSNFFSNSVGTTLTIEEYKDSIPQLNGSAVIFSYNSSIKNEEGYYLNITPNGISVQASNAHGMFHAVTTIRQMLPAQLEKNMKLSHFHKHIFPILCSEIYDYPRFKYRGFMLDVGRHFSTVQEVKRMIDILALHKMNTLHFHLTEDQGWRIEIKKYPKLTEIGAWRESMYASTLTKANKAMFEDNQMDKMSGFVGLDENDPHFDTSSSSFEKNGNNEEISVDRSHMYGGFYTQEEIKDIVNYAKKRFIRVQPEIETPGHAVAAIASYPELSCKGEKVKVVTDWGIFSPVFCTKNLTITFLEDVFTEVMQLFPSPMIHMGGDECPEGDWSTCSNCKDTMTRENLTSFRSLHGYIIKHLEDCVAKDTKIKRRLIGWDEVFSSGHLSNDTAVMVWQSASFARGVVSSGRDAVLTPMSHCYFDFGEARASSYANGGEDSLSRRNGKKGGKRIRRGRTYGDVNSIEEMEVPERIKKLLREEEQRQADVTSLSPKERKTIQYWKEQYEAQNSSSSFNNHYSNSNHNHFLNTIPNKDGGGLGNVYSFDPLELTFGNTCYTEDAAKHVLGGQANLWTEHLPTQQKREFNTLPRLAGLCEALWTPLNRKNWNSFHNRVSFSLAERYDEMGLTYNPSNLLKKNEK